MRTPLIKICGLTRPGEAAYLNEAAADFAGFIQYVPKSRRNISPARAQEIMRELDAGIRTVAVTVSPGAEEIRRIEAAGFQYLQIHGPVDRSVLEMIRLPVIRAFNVTDMDQYALQQQEKHVAYCLFDASVPGSGQTFDWTLMQTLPLREKPVFLAGGLHPGNVRAAIRAVGPDGIDVSSGVERAGGDGKSRERILELVRAVRLPDEQVSH